MHYENRRRCGNVYGLELEVLLGLVHGYKVLTHETIM